MRVLVAGAHGQVGQHVTELLSNSEHDTWGMVRDEAQVDDVEDLGAEAIVADLTADVTHAVQGCDAVVFAAGSSGEDVWGVDRDGAINLMGAAEANDAERFVMLSAMNADSPEESPEELREYLDAKAEADQHLRESPLDYTIVRPGALTNEDGTGEVRVGAELDRDDAEIPREDVARTLVATLPLERTHGRTFELLSGDEPIESALDGLDDETRD
ncbi:SDR family oxidoreductase [Halomarina salina]|uniref:SDR family oxidoreductase n=1 Tax=Halomarina salina TaxID=1872699 RepID=A0ABD5RMI1_9EURY|nr:SDR family oxidoreductase [Halomarina salina]